MDRLFWLWSSTGMNVGMSAAITALRKARYPILTSGAGISAESGIPTFRGKDGLWKNYRAEELATPGAFAENPELVWEWYNWRRDIVLSKEANPAHHAAAALQRKIGMPIITQNVDGLHRAGGAEAVIEMHGNILEARCLSCGETMSHTKTDSNAPLCPMCSTGRLRPNIVWFGESLDPQVMGEIASHLAQADFILIVGTSGIVYPAAGFASQVLANGGTSVEINIEEQSASAEEANRIYLSGPAGELLPELASNVL